MQAVIESLNLAKEKQSDLLQQQLDINTYPFENGKINPLVSDQLLTITPKMNESLENLDLSNLRKIFSFAKNMDFDAIRFQLS